MPERIKINERISYIKAGREPLSADVVLIEGENCLHLFDVGNNGEIAGYLDALPKKKKVVLSHFHPDHIGNIGRISMETLYVGAETEKHLKKHAAGLGKDRIRTVTEPVRISDGAEIVVYPMPNSHAKGSLAVLVDKEYLFLGDALYPRQHENRKEYNAQLLKEEIELLKQLPAEMIFSSHEARPLKQKDGVLRFLEAVYERREKNEAYIDISGMPQ